GDADPRLPGEGGGCAAVEAGETRTADSAERVARDAGAGRDVRAPVAEGIVEVDVGRGGAGAEVGGEALAGRVGVVELVAPGIAGGQVEPQVAVEAIARPDGCDRAVADLVEVAADRRARGPSCAAKCAAHIEPG